MIPKYLRGTSFGPLIRYLVHAPQGDGRARAGATVLDVRGVLGVETAAIEMAAVARRSERICKPVVHLSLSLAPSERLDDVQWRAVVDRAERELKLIGHQRVVVRHDDAAHSHVHIMWNAIHPETSRTPSAEWDCHIKRRLSALCRTIEPQLKLSTPGRSRVRSVHQTHDAPLLVPASPHVIHVSPGQRSRERRTGELPLAESHGARIKAALRLPTWDARAAELAAIGLRLRLYSAPRNPHRRGLVIEDIVDAGRRCVGSDLGSDYGLKALERRCGETLDQWRSRQPAQPPPNAAGKSESAHVASDQDGARHWAAYLQSDKGHKLRRDDLRRAHKHLAHEHLLQRTEQRDSQRARRRRVWRAGDSPGMRWLIRQIADWRERREGRALQIQQRREREELSNALGVTAPQGWGDYLALQAAAGDAGATRILARMKRRERLQADRIQGESDTRPLAGRAQTRAGAPSVHQTNEAPSLSPSGVRSRDPSGNPIRSTSYPAGSDVRSGSRVRLPPRRVWTREGLEL